MSFSYDSSFPLFNRKAYIYYVCIIPATWVVKYREHGTLFKYTLGTVVVFDVIKGGMRMAAGCRIGIAANPIVGIQTWIFPPKDKDRCIFHSGYI